LDWQFAGIAPVRSAGESDLVLPNIYTGAFQVYDSAFNAVIGSASLGAVGMDWQLGRLAVDPPDAAAAMRASASFAACVEIVADDLA
jgi:hypothetical protein